MADGMVIPVKRERVERAIETLMALLDEMDLDPDLEPGDEDVERDGREPEEAF